MFCLQLPINYVKNVWFFLIYGICRKHISWGHIRILRKFFLWTKYCCRIMIGWLIGWFSLNPNYLFQFIVYIIDLAIQALRCGCPQRAADIISWLVSYLNNPLATQFLCQSGGWVSHYLLICFLFYIKCWFYPNFFKLNSFLLPKVELPFYLVVSWCKVQT